MDIKQMFSNLPLFLSHLKHCKDTGKVYQIDEQYLMSLRNLTSDTDSRKQWLGYFLISTTLDTHTVACIP